MFIEERHSAILKILEKQGRISVGEIQSLYGVSADSARRDLRILEEKGLLKRTYGGAMSMCQTDFYGVADISSREQTLSEKENYIAIAQKAVSMIVRDDVVYITSANLGLLMSKSITADMRFTLVTNSLAIAEEIKKNPAVTVIVTGGVMEPDGIFNDSFTMELLGRLRFDKCFITAACVSHGFGLSVQRPRSVGIIRQIIENSKSIIGLFPTDTIGADSAISICSADKLDCLITDSDAPRNKLKELSSLGIEIIQTESGEHVPVHKNAKMVDERYDITPSERKKILSSVFYSLTPPKLKVFSSKEKKKIVILSHIVESFKLGEVYTETQVNDILSPIYDDYATVRRYLIEYGFMVREKDCSEYRRT